MWSGIFAAGLIAQIATGVTGLSLPYGTNTVQSNCAFGHMEYRSHPMMIGKMMGSTTDMEFVCDIPRRR